MKPKKYILYSFLLILLVIGFFSSPVYYKDILFSIAIMLILYFLYDKILMTPITFALVGFALFLHNLGSFGLYSINPVHYISFDGLTHFFGLLAASLTIANFLAGKLSKDKQFRFNDFLILLIIVLASLGVGSIVENIEFGSYYIFGEGEGFFAYGAGDFDSVEGLDTLMNIVGGGYFDAMQDLVVNLIGSLVGIIIFSVRYFVFKKSKL